MSYEKSDVELSDGPVFLRIEETEWNGLCSELALARELLMGWLNVRSDAIGHYAETRAFLARAKERDK